MNHRAWGLGLPLLHWNRSGFPFRLLPDNGNSSGVNSDPARLGTRRPVHTGKARTPEEKLRFD